MKQHTSESPISLMTIYFLPFSNSSLRSLFSGEEAEPAIKQPASLAMIAPAHISQGLHPCYIRLTQVFESSSIPATYFPIHRKKESKQ